MSPRGGLFGAAWLLTATGLVALVRVAAGPMLAARALRISPAAHTWPARSLEYPAESLGRAVVAGNLFRFDRRVAAVRYDPLRAPGIETPVSAPPKPALMLVGVIAGREPTAVIEGFPATEGARVVRAGDVVAGLRVQNIKGEHIRIVGMDTSWVLTVREPWK